MLSERLRELESFVGDCSVSILKKIIIINMVMLSLVIKFCKGNSHSMLLPTGYGLLLTTKTRICVLFTYLLTGCYWKTLKVLRLLFLLMEPSCRLLEKVSSHLVE